MTVSADEWACYDDYMNPWGARCTLPDGHNGDHVAVDVDGRVLASWRRGEGEHPVEPLDALTVEQRRWIASREPSGVTRSGDATSGEPPAPGKYDYQRGLFHSEWDRKDSIQGALTSAGLVIVAFAFGIFLNWWENGLYIAIAAMLLLPLSLRVVVFVLRFTSDAARQRAWREGRGS